MSQKLELSVEGWGTDGQILVVDGWPNFRAVDMPKCPEPRVIKKVYTLEAPKVIQQPPPKPDRFPLGLSLVAIVLAVIALSRTLGR